MWRERGLGIIRRGLGEGGRCEERVTKQRMKGEKLRKRRVGTELNDTRAAGKEHKTSRTR